MHRHHTQTIERVGAYVDSILSFAGIEGAEIDWGHRFVTDGELN